MLLSLYEYLLDCPIKKYLGIECLGCGFQRSIVLLTEGKILDSIKMYPATIPLLALWLYVALHVYFEFKHGARIIKYFFIFCASLIFVHYFFKTIARYAFQ